MKRSVCGVPELSCNGGLVTMNAGWPNKSAKVHNTPNEAFRCHCKWLRALGFKQIGSREFEDPHSGAVRVLTKPSRFGGVLRMGKGEGKQTAARCVPLRGGGAVF